MKFPRVEEGAQDSKEAPANPQLALPHHTPCLPSFPPSSPPAHAPCHPQLSSPALPTPSLLSTATAPAQATGQEWPLTVGTVILSYPSPVPCPFLSWGVASKKHPSSLAHLFQSIQPPRTEAQERPLSSSKEQRTATLGPSRGPPAAPTEARARHLTPQHLQGPRARFLPGHASRPRGQATSTQPLPTLFTQSSLWPIWAPYHCVVITK